ncbi:MAG: MlaD family protein [Acidobacteria bacterium]|nr:MlaD family protein [Acidobacteriota bacterium]
MPPAKKTIGLREVRVGIFIMVAVVVLIVLILNASGDISFKSKKHLKVKFATAEGLRKGGEVRLAGVRIGRVDDVNLLPPTDNPKDPRVEALLSVDSKVDGKPITDFIRTDSEAQLTSPSLLGSDKIISITTGTALGKPIPDNSELRSTTEGGMAQLTASGNQLVDQLNRLSEQMTGITTKINEGQGTLGRFVNDEAFYDNLNLTVREAQAVIREIRSGQGTAAKLVNDPAVYNNVSAITARLNEIAEDLRRGRGTARKLRHRRHPGGARHRRETSDRRDALQRHPRGHRALQQHRRARRQHRRQRPARRGDGREAPLRRQALQQRQPALLRDRQADLRLPPEPEEVPDHQVLDLLASEGVLANNKVLTKQIKSD